MKKLTPTGSAIVISGSGSPRPSVVEQVVDVLGEEAVVLEDAQDDQVERDRDADDPLARALVVAAVDQRRGEPGCRA